MMFGEFSGWVSGFDFVLNFGECYGWTCVVTLVMFFVLPEFDADFGEYW